jgi:hypothetical protein
LFSFVSLHARRGFVVVPREFILVLVAPQCEACQVNSIVSNQYGRGAIKVYYILFHGFIAITLIYT